MLNPDDFFHSLSDLEGKTEEQKLVLQFPISYS